MNALDWINRIEKVIVDADVSSHSYLTNKVAEDYLRLSCETIVDSYDTTTLGMEKLL